MTADNQDVDEGNTFMDVIKALDEVPHGRLIKKGYDKELCDDMRTGRVVNSEENTCKLQDDIDGMVNCAEQWNIEFNVFKSIKGFGMSRDII
eukprot:g31200.t1